MSAWGCLGRTIVFTLVLFAAYVFFGLLLEALQYLQQKASIRS